jgi:hypothetical protein
MREPGEPVPLTVHAPVPDDAPSLEIDDYLPRATRA